MTIIRKTKLPIEIISMPSIKKNSKGLIRAFLVGLITGSILTYTLTHQKPCIVDEKAIIEDHLANLVTGMNGATHYQRIYTRKPQRP
jgi:hypothetical protein